MNTYRFSSLISLNLLPLRSLQASRFVVFSIWAPIALKTTHEVELSFTFNSKLSLKVYFINYKEYLNMEPKPPFPPAKETVVRTKVAVLGQGLQLPGKISVQPTKNLHGTFSDVMARLLRSSLIKRSCVKKSCFSN